MVDENHSDVLGESPEGVAPPVLIAGGEGQLGRELARAGGASVLALGRLRLDLEDAASIERCLDRQRPQAVINCAAYTQVDRAESEPERCRAVNVEAVRRLAVGCERRGIRLVHVSTDYVFGGPGRRPRREDEEPSPRGVYAVSKRDGELAALESCSRVCVVRTCGLYDPVSVDGTTNFVKTMLRLGRERQSLRIVRDQRCTPTYVRDLAPALLYVAASQVSGVLHVTNLGETTWYDFAGEIFGLAGVSIELEAITSEQYGAPAPRPSYSVLSCERYERLGGPALRGWKEALAAALVDPEAPG